MKRRTIRRISAQLQAAVVVVVAVAVAIAVVAAVAVVVAVAAALVKSARLLMCPLRQNTSVLKHRQQWCW